MVDSPYKTTNHRSASLISSSLFLLQLFVFLGWLVRSEISVCIATVLQIATYPPKIFCFGVLVKVILECIFENTSWNLEYDIIFHVLHRRTLIEEQKKCNIKTISLFINTHTHTHTHAHTHTIPWCEKQIMTIMILPVKLKRICLFRFYGISTFLVNYCQIFFIKTNSSISNNSL